jgi:hypothetical protein
MVAKDGPGQYLSDANDAEIIIGSQEINDGANVVDPARAGSYKRVAEPLSQLEDQGGAPMK